jgi:hypothetical protein
MSGQLLSGIKETLMKGMALGTLALSLLLGMAVTAHAQTIKLGQVLVFHIPDLKPEADLKAFESYVTGQAPTWTKNAPGLTLHLVKKDRGKHPGQYLMVWTADTIAQFKSVASPSGDFPFGQAVIDKTGDFRKGLAPFVNGPGTYVEYHLVAPEKVGAPLPVVDVLGNHYIKVRPDRAAAFDQFVASKLHPAVGNLRPDLRLLYYKPVRGEQPGNYVTVFALTKSSRDKYWPKGADSDDVKAAFSPSVAALTTEFQTYLVPNTWGTGMAAAVYEAQDWADWTILP